MKFYCNDELINKQWRTEILDFEDFAKENTNDLFHLILTVAISEFNILHSILVV